MRVGTLSISETREYRHSGVPHVRCFRASEQYPRQGVGNEKPGFSKSNNHKSHSRQARPFTPETDFAAGRESNIERTRQAGRFSNRALTIIQNCMNLFDLKAALLAKHAQHPVVIHFPIALFIISVAFDLLAIWKRNPAMAKAAYYNLVTAALTTPVAVLSGLAAWQWQLEGAKLKGNLLLHLIFALTASGMIWLLCGWRIHQRRFPQRTPGIIYIALAL